MSDADEKIKQLSDFRTLLLTSVVSAMALVVGLFWNDAIKSTIEQVVPKGESLFYKYLAAIVVTVVVVIFVYTIIHGQREAERQLKKLEEIKNARKIFKKS